MEGKKKNLCGLDRQKNSAGKTDMLKNGDDKCNDKEGERECGRKEGIL